MQALINARVQQNTEARQHQQEKHSQKQVQQDDGM
jgi:hypothetical protein